MAQMGYIYVLHTVSCKSSFYLSRKRFIRTGILSPTMVRSECPCKEYNNQFLPSFLMFSGFPLSWSVYHPWGCSFLQWLAECKYSQAAVSLVEEGLLCSSLTLALQSTAAFTYGNGTFWHFSHSGYFGKFFFCTVRTGAVMNTTIVSGPQSALLCFRTDVCTSAGPSLTCYFLTLLIF